jgi:predicted nucleic acid-binding protein
MVNTAVVLDAGPIGTLANPRGGQRVLACRSWTAAITAAGRRIIVPEVADYEIRRELIRLNARRSLLALDALANQFEYLPLSSAAMRLAAEFWAAARRGGFPTAPDPAIDGDVILAAQAVTLGIPVTVATGNARHLSRFVAADDWPNIVP